MPVLYRKYRPQKFADVVGQNSIIKTLQNQIQGGKLAHAYLFTGSRGVGKTSVARILAKAVNCVNRSETDLNDPKSKDACGECSVCKAIEAGNFIDLTEIDAASNTGVDNVRDIIEHVKFAPSTGKYKVFIVDEVHMLSKGAFNALLKTLEEPPRHAIFILATTEIQKVPATIISRTQRFDFKAHSQADIKGNLERVLKAEGLNYSAEILDLVAQNAQGSARDSLSILDKISTLGSEASLEDIRSVLGVTDQALLAELASLIFACQVQELPQFFEKLLERGVDFAIFNKDFLEKLRQLLVQKVLGQETEVKASAADLMFVIRLFLRSFKDLQSSPSPEIPLLVSSIEAALKKTPAEPKVQKIAVAGENKSEGAEARKVEIKNEIAATALDSQFSSAAFDAAAIDEVIIFWPKIVAKIKDQNGPLGSLLKASQITAVENGKVVVLVKYEFDRKTLEKNSLLIMDAIKIISGKNLGILAQVTQAQEQNPPVAAISDALQIFGGELVE